MVELEVIPACRHYGLGLIPWSPLGGGLLGGALEKMQTDRRMGECFNWDTRSGILHADFGPGSCFD